MVQESGLQLLARAAGLFPVTTLHGMLECRQQSIAVAMILGHKGGYGLVHDGISVDWGLTGSSSVLPDSLTCVISSHWPPSGDLFRFPLSPSPFLARPYARFQATRPRSDRKPGQKKPASHARPVFR